MEQKQCLDNAGRRGNVPSAQMVGCRMHVSDERNKISFLFLLSFFFFLNCFMLGCSAGGREGFQAEALVERDAAKFCKEEKKRAKENKLYSENMSPISGVGEEAAAWPVSPDANRKWQVGGFLFFLS